MECLKWFQLTFKRGAVHRQLPTSFTLHPMPATQQSFVHYLAVAALITLSWSDFLLQRPRLSWVNDAAIHARSDRSLYWTVWFACDIDTEAGSRRLKQIEVERVAHAGVLIASMSSRLSVSNVVRVFITRRRQETQRYQALRRHSSALAYILPVLTV